MARATRRATVLTADRSAIVSTYNKRRSKSDKPLLGRRVVSCASPSPSMTSDGRAVGILTCKNAWRRLDGGRILVTLPRAGSLKTAHSMYYMYRWGRRDMGSSYFQRKYRSTGTVHNCITFCIASFAKFRQILASVRLLTQKLGMGNTFSESKEVQILEGDSCNSVKSPEVDQSGTELSTARKAHDGRA